MSRPRREHAVLLALGLQDRPFRALPEPVRRIAFDRALALRTTAERIGLPTLIAELDPRSQGRTLAQLSHDTAFEHRLLSAWSCAELRERLVTLAPRDVVLFGMETHLTVAHTTEDLLEAGYRVHVVADACLCRTTDDAERALHRLDRLGAWITTTHAVIYSLVDDTRDPVFHELIRSLR